MFRGALFDQTPFLSPTFSDVAVDEHPEAAFDPISTEQMELDPVH